MEQRISGLFTRFAQGRIGTVILTVVAIVVAVSALRAAALVRLYPDDTSAGSVNPYGWWDDGTVVRLNDIGDLVGIGTTTPAGKLHVVGGNALFGGNVGIGLTNPDSIFDVRGQLLASGASGAGYRAFFAGSSPGGVTKFGATSGGGQTRGPLSIVTNDLDRIFVDVEGNVGIGMTSPTSLLHLNAPTELMKADAAGSTRFRLSHPGGGDIAIENPGAANMRFLTNAIERMRITDAGNVGIGTTSPGSKLELVGGRAAFRANNEPFSLGVTYGTATTTFFLGADTNGDGVFSDVSGNERVRITQAGNVGIGTTSPTAKLDVAGDVNVGGNVAWTGSLTSGSVPWARLTGFPGACPGGQFVTSVGGTLICAVPPAYVGGSGFSGYLASFTGSTTIGNSGVFESAGNVGVGTVTPAAKLDVNGSLNAAGAASFGSNVSWAGTLTNGAVPWARLTSYPSGCPAGQYVSAVGGTLTCTTLPQSVGGSGTTNYLSKFTGSTSVGSSNVYDNGTNVGIGTVSPAGKLHVVGGNALFDGNVGIGTTAPTSKMEVAADQTFAYPFPGRTKGSLHLNPTAGTNDNSQAITFGANDLGGIQNSAQAGIYVQSSNVYGTKMYFATTDFYGAGSKARMIIDHLGNVGIGTTSPAERLDLGGGNIKMGYEIVTNQVLNTSGATVFCPAGKNPVGGGCKAPGSSLSYSVPYSPNGWECQSTSVATYVQVYAICANIR